MMISLRALLILLLLTFLAGLLILTPLAQWLQGILNGVSQATAPVANTLNTTSDGNLCRGTGIIGC